MKMCMTEPQTAIDHEINAHVQHVYYNISFSCDNTPMV